jgi:ferric-dicitrate binding protein FerR (iron transport regulator)
MHEQGIRKNAIAWMNILDDSAQIEKLWTSFEAWLDADPRHRETYHLVELARAETEVSLLEPLRGTPEAEALLQHFESKRLMRSATLRRVLRAAFFGLVVLSFAVLLFEVSHHYSR